jgi:hypothetical protein
MYTAIQHHDGGGQAPDDLARTSRTLANRLSTADGFIAYLLVEMADGNYASICIFEDETSLAKAETLVAGPILAGQGVPWTCLAQPIVGEVLAQKGL